MTEDLARLVHPVSGFLDPVADEPAARFRLDDEGLAFFAEHGYLGPVPLLGASQVAALRAELDRFFDPGHDGRELWYGYVANASEDPTTRLFHAMGAWRVGAAFHDLLWHPGILEPAARVLDGPVRFLHDQLFCKPPAEGGVVSWHQDYSYWSAVKPMAHLTCWIALDDATEENGCLTYVPGSHRWGLLPVTGLTGAMDAIDRVLSPDQRAVFRPRPMEVPAGHALFHHPLMVHGSLVNRSARPRRATVVNLMRDGARFAVDFPTVDGVPGWLKLNSEETPEFDPDAPAEGPALAEPFFPLLHPGPR